MEWGVGRGDGCAVDLASKTQTKEEEKKKRKMLRMKEKGRREEAELFPPPLPAFSGERKASHQELESLHKGRRKTQQGNERTWSIMRSGGGGRREEAELFTLLLSTLTGEGKVSIGGEEREVHTFLQARSMILKQAII